jgi:hypothetical protein
LYGGYLNLFQTKRAVTTGAIEMGVFFLIIMVVFTVVVANVVFQRPAAVIHGMDKSVKEEKGKCAGYGAFINGWQQLFQPWQRQHLIATMQLLKYEQPRGGGLYVVML